MRLPDDSDNNADINDTEPFSKYEGSLLEFYRIRYHKSPTPHQFRRHLQLLEFLKLVLNSELDPETATKDLEGEVLAGTSRLLPKGLMLPSGKDSSYLLGLIVDKVYLSQRWLPDVVAMQDNYEEDQRTLPLNRFDDHSMVFLNLLSAVPDIIQHLLRPMYYDGRTDLLSRDLELLVKHPFLSTYNDKIIEGGDRITVVFTKFRRLIATLANGAKKMKEA